MPVHNFIDLRGQKFGRLTVLEKVSFAQGQTFWLCLCECGIPTRVRSRELRVGKIRSCGCLRVDTWKAIRARQLRAAA